MDRKNFLPLRRFGRFREVRLRMALVAVGLRVVSLRGAMVCFTSGLYVRNVAKVETCGRLKAAPTNEWCECSRRGGILPPAAFKFAYYSPVP